MMHLEDEKNIIMNPGCGILYQQRGRNKISYEDVAESNWFFQEKLTDKIAFSLPWSILEPEERRYCWDDPDWEGCINSWIENGFKVPPPQNQNPLLFIPDIKQAVIYARK